MLNKRILPLTLLVPLLCTACTSQQKSVDKNARHAAAGIAQLHFDPNSRPLTADNTRVLKPIMQEFYDVGKKDRAAGLTLAQAKQHAEGFKCPGIIPGGDKTIMAGKEYEADSPIKQQQIIVQGATAAYLDGYNGVP